MGTLHIEPFDKQAFLDHFDELLRAREETLDEGDAQLDRLLKVWEARLACAEKLILLDAGTFALTLTFLSGLTVSHSAVRSLPHGFLTTVYCAGRV